MRLIVVEGAHAGITVPVGISEVIIGRAPGLDITLSGVNVSRRHSRVWMEGDSVFVEDLGSSNGTFINRRRISSKTLFQPNDLLGVGSHLIRLERGAEAEAEITIQRQTLATPGNQELFRVNSAEKLKTVLELAHLLSRTLDVESLLDRLLTQLMVLFPQASRSLVIFPGNESPTVRAMKERASFRSAGGGLGFSRSVTRRVLEQGVAVLAADTREWDANSTLSTLGIRSLLCVPLLTQTNRVFGVIELDRFEFGCPFSDEDLNLLTAIALQASTVLENATLHSELLENQRIQQDLALAREIQQGFLPQEAPTLSGGPIDLVGSLYPAHEVSGDFYDFIPIDDRRVALVVADVSGKGMPAALFMTMVRALLRQLVETLSSPSVILSKLNDALARDNPKFMFVTLIVAIYDASKGECLFSRGGHPPALLRRRNGEVGEVAAPTGTLIGIATPYPKVEDVVISMSPGDALLCYTDGVTEASKKEGGELFGSARLKSLLESVRSEDSLQSWALETREAIRRFTQTDTLMDDVTLLILRRP